MKTSIEISDSIYVHVQRLARQRKTTLRALVEEGLRLLLRQQSADAGFMLKDCSYGEGWVKEEFRDRGWDAIRDETYSGRGA